ncbi:MAG: HAD hydrolase family protein [Chloroflexota bacterium]
MKFICFDLEGPLSPQDNAYELMKSIPNGGHIFEVISRYDDLITFERRENYEPGDTLALIAPFLISHGLPEEDIITLAGKAGLVQGAPDLISALRVSRWQVYCISTSYEQYARRISQRVGISPHNIACTRFPLDSYRWSLEEENIALVKRAQQDLSFMTPEADDKLIKERLDRFFYEEIPPTSLGRFMKEITPVGGQRKVDALNTFAVQSKCSLEDTVVIGDSITDFKMLKAVNEAGGLAVAFNANEYALPYATIGLASTHISDLAPILNTWEKGNKRAVEALVMENEKGGGEGDRAYFHWFRGREDFSEPLKIHKRIRNLVREEAGKLG